MDVGDYIFAVQTVVVLLTGVVVFWYARETHSLRNAAQRQLEISGKSAILAAKMQYLVAMEEKNNIWISMGKQTSVVTYDLEKRINALQAEIDQLSVAQ
jgi:hypothetical protein